MVITRSIAAEPCPEQSQLDFFRFGAIASADIGMAYADLADHFTQDVCEVVTVVYVWQKGFVLFLNIVPVQALHVGCIEEILHLPPCFMIDLVPFRFQVNHQLHIRKIGPVLNLDFAAFRKVDHSVLTLGHDQHFLQIGRDIIAVKIAKD